MLTSPGRPDHLAWGPRASGAGRAFEAEPRRVAPEGRGWGCLCLFLGGPGAFLPWASRTLPPPRQPPLE